MSEIKYPTTFVVAITVFYGLMLFIFFEAFRTNSFPGLVLMAPIFLLLYDFATRMEYNPIHKNPNFLALDGTISVIESPPQPIHGGQSIVTISTKKDYVPKDKWYREGSMVGFFSHLAGKVQFKIKDDSWKFIQITGNNLGAKEGAFLYLGSLSGKPAYDLNEELMRRLDETNSLVRTMETVYERAKQVASSMARSNNLDMLEVQQQFAIILREMDEAFNSSKKKEARENVGHL